MPGGVAFMSQDQCAHIVRKHVRSTAKCCLWFAPDKTMLENVCGEFQMDKLFPSISYDSMSLHALHVVPSDVQYVMHARQASTRMIMIKVMVCTSRGPFYSMRDSNKMSNKPT